MKIVNAYPPNYNRIVTRFPEARKSGVIFTYAPIVYAPGSGKISAALKAHEAVHLHQQGEDPEGWWFRYFYEYVFRFEQELEAHRAEYAWFKRRRSHKARGMLHLIAGRLAGPLYGCRRSVQECARLIGEKKMPRRGEK